MVRHQTAGRRHRREGSERPQLHEQPRRGPRWEQHQPGADPVDLRPASRGRLPIDEVIAELRPKLAQVPGMRAFMVNQPPISLGGRAGPAACTSSRCRTPTPTSCTAGRRFSRPRCASCPASRTSAAICRSRTRRSRSTWIATRFRPLGLTVNQVETALYNAYGTRQVSTIYAPNNQYQVILQVAPEFQRDPSALSMLYVRSSSGQLIPLDTVAKVTTSAGPLTVSHTGQLPSVTISFNLKPGTALGDAVVEPFRRWPRRRCPRRSPRASRAPRRPSRIRCRASA